MIDEISALNDPYYKLSKEKRMRDAIGKEARKDELENLQEWREQQMQEIPFDFVIFVNRENKHISHLLNPSAPPHPPKGAATMNKITVFLIVAVTIAIFSASCFFVGGSIQEMEKVLYQKGYNEGYKDGFSNSYTFQQAGYTYSSMYGREEIGLHWSKYISDDAVITDVFNPWGNCTQNETGQDPNDLVMHMYCTPTTPKEQQR